MVVLLAGSVVFVRVALVCAVVAPALLPQLAPALLAGGAPMLVAGLANLRRLAAAADPQAAAPQVGNPAELSTAVAFGAFYALVLLLAAELTQRLGGTGLYGVALVSGLTDVDALTLSSLRLFGVASISAEQAVVAIALAFVANIGFKFAMAGWMGGSALARRSAPGFLASAAALLVAAGLA
jgi:uncharacterized membrane protein (DUF4010 family)